MFNQNKMLKQKSYSITGKLIVTASLKCGESQANVYHDDCVPEPTICGWLRDEDRLYDSVDMVNCTDSMNRKKARTAKAT